MNIEITRGYSEIYDILTHLTFLFIESHKIRNAVLMDKQGNLSRDWEKIVQIFHIKEKLNKLVHVDNLEASFTDAKNDSRLVPILIVGVNGSGKTTTIGKLANYFQRQSFTVALAACDTFRAAANEQLIAWGIKNSIEVLESKVVDPAAAAFEAIQVSKKKKTDILLIDTAGRLQNKSDLMQELVKVVNVIKKVKKDAPENVILVLDATTGQNIISQVEVFQEMVNVTGLIMTKLDGSAKGGILIAVADKFKLPIHAIGIGETIEDLQPFDPKEFALALLGDFRE